MLCQINFNFSKWHQHSRKTKRRWPCQIIIISQANHEHWHTKSDTWYINHLYLLSGQIIHANGVRSCVCNLYPMITVWPCWMAMGPNRWMYDYLATVIVKWHKGYHYRDNYSKHFKWRQNLKKMLVRNLWTQHISHR